MRCRKVRRNFKKWEETKTGNKKTSPPHPPIAYAMCPQHQRVFFKQVEEDPERNDDGEEGETERGDEEG
ncbi:hypothetical protein SLA2020_087850 [Shorea laevis]